MNGRAIVGLLLLVGVSAGCASNRTPIQLPPQTVTVPAPADADPETIAIDPLPEPEAGEPEATQPPPAAETPPSPGSSAANGSTDTADSAEPRSQPVDESEPIVIGEMETGADSEAREVLRELSRSERERERSAPVLILTDDNLAEKAAGGRVTLAGPPVADPEQATAEGTESAEPDALEELGEQERFWRSRALDIRQRWRAAYDELDELEAEAERLRTAFYAEDDPVRRDRQIKPLWDRTLDRLEERREELARTREELDLLYGEGTAAGALPGWLREGIDLGPEIFESTEPEEERFAEQEPGEPVLIEGAAEPPSR